ncbi:MAG: 16S rRNA (uracil(1498)-N(3))-methyltransferase [Spirochaetales bacterium]|nr:16S rRNA (uracil(1498)-N(3))-methyltransferase [Spirochaetales bacterium]
MKQFILPLEPDSRGFLTLSGRDYHYLIRVRRYREGDSLPVVLGGGVRVTGTIEKISSSQVRMRVMQGSESAETTETFPDLRLLLGFPKGKKLEQSLRQSTELGVRHIYPIFCDHSIPDPDPRTWAQKRTRLGALISEAAQQSNCLPLPVLHDPQTLDDFFRAFPDTQDRTGIFFHEKPLEQRGIADYLGSTSTPIYLLVGPEGGISPREVELLVSRGFHPGYLGQTVMRCETAVVAALASVKTMCLEASLWAKVKP